MATSYLSPAPMKRIIQSLKFRNDYKIKKEDDVLVDLQDYLITIPGVSNSPTFFGEDFSHNMYRSLMVELSREKTDPNDAAQVLAKFDAYTWSNKAHLRASYFVAGVKVYFVQNHGYIFYSSPNLAQNVEDVLSHIEFHACKSFADVEKAYERIEKTESNFDDAPEHILYKSGRRKHDKRFNELSRLTRKLKHGAFELEDPLRQLGHEYRKIYNAQHDAHQEVLMI